MLVLTSKSKMSRIIPFINEQDNAPDLHFYLRTTHASEIMKEALLLKAEFLDDTSIDSKESSAGLSPASAELLKGCFVRVGKNAG